MLENLETNGFYQCFSNLWCNSNNGLYCDSTGVCSCPSTQYWTGSVCSKKLIEEDIFINRCYKKLYYLALQVTYTQSCALGGQSACKTAQNLQCSNNVCTCGTYQ